MSQEQPSSLHTSEMSETVRHYLRDLGLTVEELAGKRILDVGAGGGEFVRFANSHGANAFGLDKGNMPTQGDMLFIAQTETPYALGDAAKLPFPDASFDLVISYAAIPNITGERFTEQISKEKRDRRVADVLSSQRRSAALKEMLRVVTEKGSVICAPVVSDPDRFAHQSSQIENAIQEIEEGAEIEREPLSDTSVRLVLRRKQIS